MSDVDLADTHAVIVSFNEALLDRAAEDEAAGLIALGQGVGRLTAVVGVRGPFTERQLSANVRVLPISIGRSAGVPVPIAKGLLALDRSSPIDLIQTQDPLMSGLGASLASLKVRAKLVVCVFGTDPWDAFYRSAGAIHRLAAPLARVVIKRANIVQTDSTVIRDRFVKRGIDAAYKPMRPDDLLSFLQAGEERRYRPRGQSILFVGRLTRQKHLVLLLDAFARLRAAAPSIRLKILGDGPDRPELERHADRRGLGSAVTFDGLCGRQELAHAYLDADVLALSSYYEGMPRVFLEAGATALPIVSTPVAGALELSRHAPVVVARPSAEAMASALRGTLENVSIRRRMGQALRWTIAERNGEASITDLQLQVWREALS